MNNRRSPLLSASCSDAGFDLWPWPSFLPASARQKPVRERSAHSLPGDSFAALHVLLLFMLCYAMTVKNNLIIFYRLSIDLLCQGKT